MATAASDYAIEIKTVQTSVFKVLIEALKEMLSDTVLEVNEHGLKIVALDTSHIILVHLKLEPSRFEHFYCEAPKKIGINMLNLYKIIKTMNGHDTLTIFMKKNDQNHLGIRIENREKNECTTYKLNLLDLDNPKLDIPSAEFNSIITIPSADFQKICRDMHNLADLVEIKTIKHELILSCKGDFCSRETVLRDSDNISVEHDDSSEHEIVQGVFNLKYLTLFCKCTSLAKTVELYLKNDYPLIIRYNSSLGDIKLCLAPHKED